MIYIFYTTYTCVDFVQHEIFRAKVGKVGMNDVTFCPELSILCLDTESTNKARGPY